MTRPLAIAAIAFCALALSCHGAEPAAIPYKQAPAVDELMMRLVGGLVLVAVVGPGHRAADTALLARPAHYPRPDCCPAGDTAHPGICRQPACGGALW